MDSSDLDAFTVEALRGVPVRYKQHLSVFPVRDICFWSTASLLSHGRAFWFSSMLLGYGRYFPASVRSLAQTTTAQTVTNHMSKKCLKCPKEIRETILMLQRQETYCQQMMAMTGKSRSSQANPLETRNESSKWGKRKVFFQCLWDRLHKITPKPTNKSAEKSKKEHENNPSAHEKKTPTKIKEEGDQIDYEKGPSVAHDLSKNDGTVNDTDRGTLHANTTNKDERDKEEAITESSKGDDKPSSGKRKRSDEGEIAAAV